MASNRTLQELALCEIGFWANPTEVVAVLDAFKGHPSLTKLHLGYEALHNADAQLGASIAAVIAANTPALSRLDVHDISLDDDGLAPVLDALSRNTHLRALCCNLFRGMSEDFARHRFLPATRANTTLRALWAHSYRIINCVDAAVGAVVLEAEELVAARNAVDAAG